ncbi:hypothetical protein CVT24_004253 [Panaeolus cyanescens]|uniref:F-box domain-containing protein n=1 Tax=Panaeolus cyanescens TaxID=181874 RepID=A0A409VA74_9AGAR|nr:hypothetical protein CVT24_004253 [Panaeolus cyanescens]
MSIKSHTTRFERELQPVLPPELERIIFEMAVEDITSNLPPTRCALNLQLTAKRVRYCSLSFPTKWENRIRPLLYRIFKHTNKRVDPFPNFNGSNGLVMNEIGPFIKHFLYGSSPLQNYESMANLIRHCPNIENMSVWCDADTLSTLYPAISSLQHLKRLSARFGCLSRSQVLSPFMHRLTHLEIVGNLGWDIIIELKNLTHISTSVVVYNPYDHEFMTDPLVHVEQLLNKICSPDGCPNLRVVKIYSGSPLEFSDIRLVLLPLGLFSYEASVWDWLNGANERVDSWVFADRIVYARQMGYMAPDSSLVLDPFSFDHKKKLNTEGQAWWKGLHHPFVPPDKNQLNCL